MERPQFFAEDQSLACSHEGKGRGRVCLFAVWPEACCFFLLFGWGRVFFTVRAAAFFFCCLGGGVLSFCCLARAQAFAHTGKSTPPPEAQTTKKTRQPKQHSYQFRVDGYFRWTPPS